MKRSLGFRLASLVLVLAFLGAQPWIGCGIACQLDLHGFHLETSGHHGEGGGGKGGGEVAPCHSATLGTATTVAIDHLAPALASVLSLVDISPTRVTGLRQDLLPTSYIPPTVVPDPPPPRV